MGYGLVLISHSQDKTFENEEGVEYNQIVPTLDKGARLVCERTCDIIAYSRQVDTPEGVKTKLFLRGTPRFVAGSRFKYICDYIDFDYNELVKAISDAIEKEANENNNEFITVDSNNLHSPDLEYNFTETMDKVNKIIEKLMNEDPANSEKIIKSIESILGKGKKVTDCTPDQAELVDMVLFNLESIK